MSANADKKRREKMARRKAEQEERRARVAAEPPVDTYLHDYEAFRRAPKRAPTPLEAWAQSFGIEPRYE
jgi:DNA/RNA-binding domain of Phe-tRNA-synthetase-like protein